MTNKIFFKNVELKELFKDYISNISKDTINIKYYDKNLSNRSANNVINEWKIK